MQWTKLSVVLLLLLLILFVIRNWSWNYVKVPRQAYGEIVRFFKAAPVKNEFRHKYDTPFASQYNVNTKTNLLPFCEWMEGQ